MVHISYCINVQSGCILKTHGACGGVEQQHIIRAMQKNGYDLRFLLHCLKLGNPMSIRIWTHILAQKTA